MNIDPTSIDCHNLEEEDFQNYDEFRELTTQEQTVQTQADRIFSKGSVLCGTHELKGRATVDSDINEEYGEREYTGEISTEYNFKSDDDSKEFRAKANLNTDGQYKVEVEASYKL